MFFCAEQTCTYECKCSRDRYSRFISCTATLHFWSVLSITLITIITTVQACCQFALSNSSGPTLQQNSKPKTVEQQKSRNEKKQVESGARKKLQATLFSRMLHSLHLKTIFDCEHRSSPVKNMKSCRLPYTATAHVQGSDIESHGGGKREANGHGVQTTQVAVTDDSRGCGVKAKAKEACNVTMSEKNVSLENVTSCGRARHAPSLDPLLLGVVLGFWVRCYCLVPTPARGHDYAKS